MASTTSQKHKAFSGEPMRDKPVEDLAGIGVTLAGRLKEQGFHKVSYFIYDYLIVLISLELHVI